jgi:hypothetical protein
MIHCEVFVSAAAAFVIAFVLHVLVWRILKPRNDINALGLVFIVLPFVAGGALFLAYKETFCLADFVLSALLYLTVAAAYIQTYPGMRSNVPTLVIVNLIGRSKSGLTIEQIKATLTQEQMVQNKVEELADEGFVTMTSDQSIQLTARGRLLANCFIAYRRLLGLSEGAG